MLLIVSKYNILQQKNRKGLALRS